MTTAARLNFRVRPDTEHRLRAAAAATDQSLTDFVISAAVARADEVLASHTVVPEDYFDQLIAALDEPVTPNEPLRAVARRPRRVKQV
ncbi:MAG TPA: DUF1778 domain-containing protein [Jatrophihabitans sp.]|jgi:uncharacterized protein (DUF1778 family)|uniref:type II toxin-antitoxin system TacA family antitoxin n=1 Tax=Jatrophihabitans sp. TaxID=1932789 RepID=UPI002EE2EA86